MVWHALAQSVRDTELTVHDYFDLALAGLAREDDAALLGILIGSRGAPLAYYYGYLTRAARLVLAPRFESAIWKRVTAAPPGSSAQMTFFDAYVPIAQTPGAIARLEGFLDGRGVPGGIEIDQDRRWSVVRALAAAGRAGALARIESEMKRDPSTSGAQSGYAARAAFPDLATKQRYWRDFHASERIPFTSLLAAAQSFHDPNHPELSEPFVAPYFADATSIDWAEHDELVELFLERLFPRVLCSSELLEESRARLGSASNLIPIARRAWLEANDELATCVAVRARSALDAR
jgi:aminopeptidase N